MNELAAGKKTFKHDFSFSVAGPRFTLDPLDIYSVYPPKGAVGDFANSLPHVVFSRRTLPWERSLDPGVVRKKGDVLPWMALLTLSSSDFDDGAFPDVVSRKVGELLQPLDADNARGPDFTASELAAYESTDDLCTTIDLPWEKFERLAPSRRDLGYLSHVREVNTGDKETLSFLADGWFSVVLANRFPEPRQPFLSADFIAVPTFVEALKEDKPLAKYLWGRFEKDSQQLLRQDSADHRSVLLDEFNKVVRGHSIHLIERFADMPLSEPTRRLLAEKAPQGSDLIRLNRLLLEDAYPHAIAKRADFRDDVSAAVKKPLAVENRAYLVSLEGMTGYLPGAKNQKTKDKKHIRLAVLASWSFHCEEAFTFKASMNKLDVKRLSVPWDKPEPSANVDVPERQVFDAFERGYTALNHSTRLGEKTVSWYRGPLVPLDLTKESKYTFRPTADAAVRYNPVDGIMDVSYAAAYQLGRLLGLHDRHFATALYAYRSGISQQWHQSLSKQLLRNTLGTSQSGNNETQNEIMSHYIKNALGSVGSLSVACKKVSLSGFTAISSLSGDDAFSRDPKHPEKLPLTTDFNLAIPKVVSKWLAQLLLVYRVPFQYLVPDERMLPADSIRFFYLDPGWLKSLLEGACSVGRTSSRDDVVDEYLRDKFLDLAITESLQVRTQMPDKTDRIEEPDKISVKPNWPLTGFLIRSPVVEGWQGLEMRAWKESRESDANCLAPLRIDRLAPDIMLCIFNGKVNRIEIKQPPEGMHFGAAPDNCGFKRFHLRRLNAVGDAGPGDQLGKESATDIPLRNHEEAKRVVEVSELATTLQQKLDTLRARDVSQGSEFTSAEFGVEMVESPGRVVFDVKNSDEKTT